MRLSFRVCACELLSLVSICLPDPLFLTALSLRRILRCPGLCVHVSVSDQQYLGLCGKCVHMCIRSILCVCALAKWKSFMWRHGHERGRVQKAEPEPFEQRAGRTV